MRLWRSHPVFFAALLGAAIGLADAFILAFAVGPSSVMTNRFLLLLWPTSILACSFLGEGSRVFTAFVLIAEFGGNSILYALAFAVLVCLVLSIRNSFGTPEKPTSIG